ncbi:MAG: glucoamylase family protein, partial [Elusimicrobia bacterium]|nr:glucoamylase family protein [Elusimicrobiota bacterium]
MSILKKPLASVAAAVLFISAPGPACYQAAAQSLGSASRAAEAASVPATGVVPALGTAAGPPSLAPLSAPTLGLPAAAVPAPVPLPAMEPARPIPLAAAQKPQAAALPELAKAMAPARAQDMPGRLDALYSGGVAKASADADAVAGTLGHIEPSGLEESSRRFFEGAAKGAWRGYFEKHVSALGLPYDNAQWLETHDPGEKNNLGLETMPDGTIRYAPTSPTNIGYYLTAVAAAKSFGWISDAEALARVRRTLKTLGQMEKWHGHLYNFYDARTLTATSRFVSTVDSGNLAAGLIAVGNLLPEIRGEARALSDAMDFGPLYDKEKGLLLVGYDAQNKAPDANHYGDYLSESRLAYLVAIGQGSVPASAWSRLDRTGSLDGGAMDHLAPLAFLDEPGHEADVRAQAKDAETLSGKSVWGKSEAAYLEKDENGHWHHRYGRFGAAGLASKKYAPGGARKEKVVSPYVSFLALAVPGVDAGAVRRNLRNLAALGLRRRDGAFLDGAQKDAETGKALPISQVFANHQGMSLAALANYLKEGMIRKAFSGDERIQKALALIDGKTAAGVERKKEGARKINGLNGVPEAHYFGAGSLFGMVTNFGSGFLKATGDVVRYVNEYLVNAFRADPVEQEAWGPFVYVSEDKAVWSTAYQPTRSADPEKLEAEFWPGGATLGNSQRGVRSTTRIWADSSVQVQEVTLTNESQHDRRLALTSFQDMALQNGGAYWAHPAYQKIFIQTKYDAEAEAIYGLRRGHAPGETWPVAFYFSDAPAGPGASFETSREAFLGKGGARAPDALAGGTLTGMTGAVIEPAAILQRSVTLKPGESRTVRFFTGLAQDEAAARATIARYRGLAATSFEGSRREAVRAAENEILAAGIAPRNRAKWASVRSQLLYPKPRPVAQESAPRTGRPAIAWRVTSESEIPDALELISLQPSWREKGAAADLVFLLDIGGALEKQRVKTALEAATTRILPGWNRTTLEGVRVLDAAEMSAAERNGLESKASVLLGVAAPTSVASPAPRREQGSKREPGTGPLFEFDSAKNEVVIFRPKDVPGVWSHVLANGYGTLKDGEVPEDGGPQYALLLTQNGGGFAARWDAQGNRTTGFTADPSVDAPAMAFHLRDLETGKHFSLTPGADASGAAEHKVRFGQEGYAVFEAAQKEAGLKASLTAFVPPDSPVAYLVVDVENLRDGPRRLDLTGLVDLALGEGPKQANRAVIVSRDPATGALLARNPDGKFPDASAFFAAVSGRPSSYGTDRASLLGLGGDLGNAAALSQPELPGAEASSGNPMAALRLPILDLAKKGDVTRVVLVLGQGKDRAEALDLVAKMQKAGAGGVVASLEETRDAWKKTRSALQISSPESSLDPMINGWLPRQALKSRMEARSGYHQASGAFGGRDQVQDSLIGLHLDPMITRNQIRLVARRQFREGDIQHWWFQFRGQESGFGVRTKFSDDLLWMPYALTQYLDATGDESLLKEREPYLLGRELNEHERDRGSVPKASPETGSVYEHATRAIDRSLSKMGEHGLPLMGTGDWNDGMGDVGAEGKGESVWLAFFLYDVLQRFAPVAEKQGDAGRAKLYRERAAALKAAIAKHAWDGKWWLRAYYDDGGPLGSVANEQWMIDSLPQAWAVISGAGDPARNKEGLESAWRYLVDEKNGIVRLGTPFYKDPPRSGQNHPGSLAGYPPGRREHGSYTHAAVWLAIGFAMQGDGDRAFELLGMLNPMVRTMTPERLAQYQQEPYAVAADRNADEPFLGRAGWTQYTGSAGWMYRAYVEYILGLRFKDGGLLVDPAIPSAWDGYTAQKTLKHPAPEGSGMGLREARYEITVRNPNHVSKGVESIRLDGALLTSGTSVVPFLDDGKLHKVEVLMGGAAAAPRKASAGRDVVKDNRIRAFVRGTVPRAANVVGRAFSHAAAAVSARAVSAYDRGYAAVRSALSLPYWLELYPAWVRVAYAVAPSGTERALRAAMGFLQRRQAAKISSEDKDYLLGVLKKTWRYYDDYAGAEYGHLIPDHIDAAGTNKPDAKEGREPGLDGNIVYAPTSPTDIGYGLIATAVAARFGLITRAQAVERLTSALKTVESLPKFNGLLYNFYHARTTVATSRFVSTVDNGNLAAALTTVGNLFPEVSASAHGLRDAMDFGLLYDPAKKLMHIGYSPDTRELTSSYYDMRVSEARTAYQEAIAKGDIPPEAWFALGHAVVRTPAGTTFSNYGGTAMEFSTPLGHLNEADLAPHTWGLVLRRFYKNQLKLARRWSLPFWGLSESGRPEASDDGDPLFGYKTHGDPELSQGHYRHNGPDKDVVTPYASVMGLSAGIAPSAVVANLRALEAKGALGPYGFWEAMAVKPDGTAAPVKQVMAHHQGMILLAIANTLTDGEFGKAYSGDARIKSRILPLIQERMPEISAARTAAGIAAPKARHLGLGNKTYGAVVAEDGSMISRGRGPLDAVLARAEVVRVTDSATGKSWSAGPDAKANYQPGVVTIRSEQDGIKVTGSLSVDGEYPVEILEMTVSNAGSTTRSLRLENPFEVRAQGSGRRPVAFRGGDAPGLVLQPGETKTVRFITGLASDPA